MSDTDWIELTVNFPDLSQEKRDIAIALLADIGFDSFADAPSGIYAYINNSLFSEDIVSSSGIFNLPVLNGVEVSSRLIEKVNWNKEWEKNFNPVIIGGRCSVRAPFHPKPDNTEFDILIEPKMSFGTGHHQTTALMMEMLLDIEVRGSKVLDMGCGTGVLAILSGIKGAASVVAVDIDEWACLNTRENCLANNCVADIRKGDISSVEGEIYDLILANITRNILTENMNILSSCLNHGGLLFLSGFYTDDITEIEKATVAAGLLPGKVLSKDEWCAASFRKQ
jgi:ribosomal protein L11 methyltransferase